MRSFIRLLFIALVLVATISASSGAPAPKEQKKRTSNGNDLQVEQLRALLAKLRAENEESSEEPTQHDGSEDSTHKKQEQDKEKPFEDSRKFYHQPRTLSAEDMHGTGADLVQQLRNLDNRRDSPQILARALAQLDEKAKSPGDEGTSNSNGDDMKTSTNEKASEDKTRKLDKEQLVEALITEALKKFNKKNKDPLTTSKSESSDEAEREIEQLLQQEEEGDAKTNEVHEGDAETLKLRQKAISLVETRMMHDVMMANEMGITVDDLIRDLENKAYMEAKLKRIEAMLSNQAYGRD